MGVMLYLFIFICFLVVLDLVIKLGMVIFFFVGKI